MASLNVEFIIYFICWVFVASFVASAAKNRGRPFFRWLGLAIVLTPIVAAVLLVFLPRLKTPTKNKTWLPPSINMPP